ncbi:suppressor of mek1 [Phlyctema vagabunda]|uniref:Suppressor of mek1 n=1 Tax=Phlyctema vagabunda TaxID=108571 RepID=A0ABR4PS77_9HELO
MAQPEKKRVKVYELKNNDWVDRGTGFCTASFASSDGSRQEVPRVIVQSEEEPERILLETKICKDDGFQKQQDTLIVWTELQTNIDMALSFQEAEGCASIWKFVNNVQLTLSDINGPEDAFSDDVAPGDPCSVHLPPPTLRCLQDINAQMQHCSLSAQGRDALGKFIINEDYIRKLIPLVDMAEDLEDLPSLHRLCNIMKTMILLNDTMIIEHAVTDDVVLGVVGALEYDPDFPSHKANHRLWLGREGRYKEVVRIEDEQIRKKIHHTYRLQYLKDVVLARILDDPTFSVLNSLIFYYQVDIVTHLQTNASFLKELFGIFGPNETDQERKKEAVLFIQQCCAVSKQLQQPARQQLYNNLLGHGLLSVINFALHHSDVGVRVGATDVLVSMIDHDPQMIRQTIFRQISEKQTPLTDSLIELLLVEADLGVKAQIADAIKVLLDPGSQNPGLDNMSKAAGDFTRLRPQPDPQQEVFLSNFYDQSAKKLFQPLVDLKDRQNMDFSVHQVSLFIYLIEILCFFIRQHQHRSKYFVLSENLGRRISQLLSSPEKYLRLTALKFFRVLVGLQDDFYNGQITQDYLFGPILDIVVETMPRDNLLNSACLEFFEYIKKEGNKSLLIHLVENYREKMKNITYVDTFNNFIVRYDQTQGFTAIAESSFMETEDGTPPRSDAGRRSRWENGIKDLDPAEEQYFNTSDDEDDEPSKVLTSGNLANGASPLSKPLVDYGSDEENDNMDAGILPAEADTPESPASKDANTELVLTPAPSTPTPPERLSEKRRREEDEEDEIGKLSQTKRRNSASSTGSAASNNSSILRKKKSLVSRDSNGAAGTKPNKIAISLSPGIKTGGDGSLNGEAGS